MIWSMSNKLNFICLAMPEQHQVSSPTGTDVDSTLLFLAAGSTRPPGWCGPHGIRGREGTSKLDTPGWFCLSNAMLRVTWGIAGLAIYRPSSCPLLLPHAGPSFPMQRIFVWVSALPLLMSRLYCHLARQLYFRVWSMKGHRPLWGVTC